MVINLKCSTIPNAAKKISSIAARLSPQEISEETQPQVDGENNTLYLCTNLTAFYFISEVPDTWIFLLTSTTLCIWFLIFCYELYWFNISDLKFLYTFITPSMLGLKPSLVWQKYFYLNVLGQQISMYTNSNTPHTMKSCSQWRYSTWKILLLFPSFQKQYLSMHFGTGPFNLLGVYYHLKRNKILPLTLQKRLLCNCHRILTWK